MQALEAGKRFARYRVQRPLGSSVSGTSYEAEDTLLQRNVTLKLVHPWARLSDAARRQFFRDMQGIGALTHPSLAAVLDYGEADGQLYIARRYVPSGSLLGNEGRNWFRPPLDIAHAVRYARQLAEALQYIHSNGFVHGSFTFTNILVLHSNDNTTPFLLADVGTAHFVRRFGKPQYAGLPTTAAPEQFGQRVTPASDQYALAVILYFWLTGRLPFLGTPEEIKQLKLTEKLSTLTALNLNVPLELEGVIRRALHAYPEERYPSVQTFANALSAAIAHATRAFPLSPSQVSQYNGDRPEATTRREVETRSEETEKMPLTYTPSSDSTATLSQESDDQAVQNHEQVFHNSPTSMLELLSGGASSSDAHAQIDPPAQPTQPTAPELPSQPSVPEQPTPPASPELPNEPAAPEEPVQPTPQTTPDLPDQPDLPSQPAQPETPNEPPAQPEHPGPRPQVTPDVPQPLPETTPEPEPLPQTPPEPTPAPTPEPDTVPPPAPDIPQPLPDPQPTPPIEPAQNAASALHEGGEANGNAAVGEQSSGVLQASLTITSPFSDWPRQVALERAETTLGRAGSSDILLDQDTVTSRHHALLKRNGNSYFIRDERSANGITIKGERIPGETDYELHDGDHIAIGEYTLVFHLKPSNQLAERSMYQVL